jgi:hypothetical protein
MSVKHKWSHNGACKQCGLRRRNVPRKAFHGIRKVWVVEYSRDGTTWIEGLPPCMVLPS